MPTGRVRAIPALAAAAVLLLVLYLVFRRESESWEYAAPLPLTTYSGDELSPAWSPDGKYVAFIWNGSSANNWDIYIKQPGVEQPARFTSDARSDMSPAWSPDGRRIAFGRRTVPNTVEIIVKAFPDGPERLIAKARECVPFGWQGEKILAWLLDGLHLVVSGADGTCGLSVLSSITGMTTRLTTPPGASAQDLAPAVAPDGHAVAFMRGSIWPAYTVHKQRLTQELKPAGAPQRLTSGDRGEMWPAWTPDAKQVFFTRVSSAADGPLVRVSASAVQKPVAIPGLDTLAYTSSLSNDGTVVYATRPPFKTNINKLLLDGNSIESFAASTYLQQSPDHSPDGRQIVFESERSGHREIWVSSENGSDLRQLTRFSGAAVQSPRWSPDGSQIAFTVAEGGGRAIYAIPSTGGSARRLTPGVADHVPGDWSPDGKWLYLMSNRTGEYRLWKMPAAGGDMAAVTETAARNPRLSPDGRYVYYVTIGKTTALWQMATSGGPPVPLADDVHHVIGIDAVPDGVYYVAAPGSDGEDPIRFVEAASRQKKQIASVAGPIGWGLSVAPDRRSLLFVRNVPGTFDLKIAKLPR